MYEKTLWETGDVITAEKLNHAETGIATANGPHNIFITLEKTSSNYHCSVALESNPNLFGGSEVLYLIMPTGSMLYSDLLDGSLSATYNFYDYNRVIAVPVVWDYGTDAGGAGYTTFLMPTTSGTSSYTVVVGIFRADVTVRKESAGFVTIDVSLELEGNFEAGHYV